MNFRKHTITLMKYSFFILCFMQVSMVYSQSAFISRDTPASEKTNASSVVFNVSFSADVTNVDAADFATGPGVSGDIAGVVANSAQSYDVTVNNLSGEGTLSLVFSLSQDIETDPGMVAFGGSATTSESYERDITAPEATIGRKTPTVQNTNASSVVFTVSFDEDVIGFDQTQLELASSGASGTINSFSASGSSVDVTVSGISGNGVIDLDFVGSPTFTDEAGNTFNNDIASEQTYTIDNAAPTFDVVTTTPSSGTRRVGQSVTINLESTNNETDYVAGTVITVNGVNRKSSFSNDGSGDYSITYPVSEGDMDWAAGALPISIDVEDALGNSTTITAFTSSNLAGDANTPAQPSTPELNDLDDTGTSSTDNITSQTSNLRFFGTGDPGSTIELYNGGTSGTLLGSTTVSGGGTWEIIDNLSANSYSITAIAKDAAGNESSETGALLLIVDDNASNPSTPDLAAADDSMGPQPGQDDSDNYTSVTTGLTISGTSDPNDVIEIFEDSTPGTTLGTTSANGSGNWVLDLSLSDGVYDLRARALDAAGNTSNKSGGLDLTVDSTPPTTPSVIYLNGITEVNTTNEDDVDLQVSNGENNSWIIATISSSGGGTPVVIQEEYTGTTENVNNFNLSGLPDGTLTATVTLTDRAGNTSLQGTADILKDTEAPVFTVAPTITNVVFQTSFTLNFAADEPGTMYWVVVDNNPDNGVNTGTTLSGVDAQEVKDEAVAGAPGNNDLGSGTNDTVIGRGTFTFGAGATSEVLPQTQLNSYDVFFVAEDNFGNLQSTFTFIGDQRASGPQITSVSATNPNGPYGIGETISIEVTIDEDVTVAGGIPTLTLETGSVDREATYVSGSGTDVLLFNYEVLEGDVSPNLDFSSSSAFNINGATIEAVGDSENLNTDLPNPGTTGSLGSNSNIVIDGIRPAVSAVEVNSTNTPARVNSDVTVTLTSNETGLTLSSTASINGQDVTTSFVDNTDNTYSLTYSVSEGDADWAAGTLPITFTLQDGVGNTTIINAFTDGNSLAGDANTPTISVLSISPNNGSVRIGQDVVITIQENANETGLQLGAASTINGVAPTFNDLSNGQYTYTYTLADGQPDWTSGALTASIRLRDAAGNTASTTVIPGNTLSGDANFPEITPITIVSNNAANTDQAKVGNTITVTATSNEPLNIGATTSANSGFTSGGVPVNNTASFAASGSGPYTISYVADVGDDEGDIEFSIDLVDIAGNVTTISSETDGSSVTFDRTLPLVSSIEIASAIESWGNNTTSASSVTFDVVFSEPVTGVSSDDFEVETQIEAGGSDPIVNGSVSGVTGSGQNYTVTVSTISGTGRLKVNLLNGTDIIDVADNSNAGFAETFADNHFYSITLPEPTNDVSNFQVGNVETTSFEVTWDEPSSPAVPATHYLVQLRNTTGSFTAVSDGNGALLVPDTDLSDNNLSIIIPAGSNSATFTGLSSGTEYFSRIYPLSFSTNNSADVVDFKTNSPQTTNGFTSVGDISSITAGPGVEPTSISILTTAQSGAIAPQLDAQSNFDFIITDDGPDNTIDNSPTKINEITILQAANNQIADWSQAFAGAEISTTGAPARTVTSIGSNQIVFGGIPAQNPGDFGYIDDGATKTFTLKVWFKTNLDGTLPNTIDEKFLEFQIDGANVSFGYDNTSQASSTIGGDQTLQSGNNTNLVDVTSVNPFMTITSNPYTNGTNNIRGLGVTETIEVQARDVNGNLDLGVDGTPTITAANSQVLFNLSSNTFNDGILTTDISFTSVGDGTSPSDGTLTITSGVLSVSTNPIDVNHSTVTNLTGGVEPTLSLFGGMVNRTLFGFQVASISGPNSDPELNEVTIRFGSDISQVLENIRLFRSADNIFGGGDANITGSVSISTPAPGDDFLTISGLSDPLDPSGNNENFFLVADIVPTVDATLPPISPTITAAGLPNQDVLITSVGSGSPSGSVTANAIGNTYNFIDILSPTVVSLTPINGSQAHPKSINLQIEFDEEVSGNGVINIYEEANDVLVVGSLAPISPLNRDFVASYLVDGLLQSDVEYYVLMAPDQFIDDSGNGFDGFTTPTDWAFKTADETPPVFDPLKPAEILNITDLGFDIRVALDEPGEIFYLVVDPDDITGTPTVDQVINGGFTGELERNSFSVDRGFEYIYQIFLNESFSGEDDFQVFLTARDNQPTPNFQTTVLALPASNFASSTNGVSIVTNPEMTLDVCTGDFQRLFTPITIQEGDDNDFTGGAGQSINFALPNGFLFKTENSGATVEGFGDNISNVNFTYINDQVLSITFDISGTNRRDKIVLRDFEIIRQGNEIVTRDMIRLGGTAFNSAIPDGSTIVSLKTVDLPPVEFTTIPNLTSIGDNVPKVVLVPAVDDGFNSFSGPGVVGDTLFTEAAGIGVHEVVLTNINDVGCNTTFSREIEIFDNDRAIRGLSPSYCADDAEAVIPLDEREFFILDLLTVKVPLDLDPDQDSVLVQTIFQDPVSGAFIFRPGLFETPENRARLGEGDIQNQGGAIGDLEFTALYTNQFTSLQETVTQRVTIFLSPRADLELSFQDASFDRVVDGNQYCEDDETILLQGSPAPASGVSTGVFQIAGDTDFPGLIDFNDGRATFNPAILKDEIEAGNYSYGTYTITYTYTSLESDCPNTVNVDFDFNPNPTADYVIGTACEDLEIEFTDMSTGANIAAWNWVFEGEGGSDNIVLSDQNPSVLYDVADRYQSSLTVVTAEGCPSQTVEKNIDVGRTPVESVEYAGISVADSITFMSTSTVTSGFTTDRIETVYWAFGDGVIFVSSDNSEVVSHRYGTSGIYEAKMTVESSFGCIDSLKIPVFVVPNEIVSTTNAFVENFNSDDGGWLSAAANDTLDSWSFNGTAWLTDNGEGTYEPNAESYLYSPAFDFSELSRPLVQFIRSFDLNGDDGVVLQYSTDNRNIGDPEKDWTSSEGGTLGKLNSGQNWYNGSNLGSQPGNQETGDFGWTGTSELLVAKQSLSSITNREKVVFRLAIAAGTRGDVSPKGFLVDNFTISEGTRTVLLESFTNMSGGASPATQNSAIRSETQEKSTQELIAISYHTNFPGEDVINNTNSSDPLSRAVYYGITSIPASQIDGTFSSGPNSGDQFAGFFNSQFDIRTLDVSPVEMSLQANIVDDQVLSAEVSMVVTIDSILNEDVIVHFALVEKEVTLDMLGITSVPTREDQFNWVLKKLLPNPAGIEISLEDLDNLGETQTVAIDPYLISSLFDIEVEPGSNNATFNYDNLAVIAFLQGKDSKVVYQSVLVDGFTPVSNIVTGIEEKLVADGLKIYPNPARDFTTLEFGQIPGRDYNLRVYDQIGQVVIQQTISKGAEKIELNTSDLSAGIFIVQLETESEVLTKEKLIVVK